MKDILFALILAFFLFVVPQQGPPTAAAEGSHAAVSLVATSYLGYGYATIGDTPRTGFSCVGLVHWAFARVGIAVPENLWALNARYTHVAYDAARPGDIVLFQNTVWRGISHAAIYLGHGLVVGADNFTVGVHLDHMWDRYWGPRVYAILRVP